MASTPYTPVTWGEEPITAEKLATMTSNDQWLFEHTPAMSYSHNGIKKFDNLKIATGTVFVLAHTQDSVNIPVEFGGFFSSSCKPIVVVGGIISPVEIRCFVGCRGFDKGLPDSRGFEIVAAPPWGNGMTVNYYIPWLAIGF